MLKLSGALLALVLGSSIAQAQSPQDCLKDLTVDAYERAVTSCTNAIRREPNNSFWYNNRCKALFHLGEHDRAIADCTKSIDSSALAPGPITMELRPSWPT